MKRLIQFFVKHAILANLLMLLIIGTGLMALYNLPSTLFPKQDPDFIAIQSAYPGASAREVEEGIVLKVEENLKGITGIKQVRSESAENMGTIMVELYPNADAQKVH